MNDLATLSSQSRRASVQYLISFHFVFLSLQVEVDWEKIRAKIEAELSKEREKAANAKSSVASRH